MAARRAYERQTWFRRAGVMGIDQFKVSALLSGRLANFLSERLMRLLTRLGQKQNRFGFKLFMRAFVILLAYHSDRKIFLHQHRVPELEPRLAACRLQREPLSMLSRVSRSM